MTTLPESGTRRSLAPGEELFHQGDEAADVFFVEAGVCQVLHHTTGDDLIVASLGPGSVVGEIAAIIGGRRTATVRAGAEPAAVLQLTADEFMAWLDERPEVAEQLFEEARDRVDHTRVARVLGDLIGASHRDVIDDVRTFLEWTRLEAGECLFEQGDPADAAYIVVTGRLRLTAESDHTGAADLDISLGRGDIVGELGIIERSPRSATATATRDTTLARLSTQDFETLTSRYPSLMLQLFRKVLTRVMRPGSTTPSASMIAVAVLDPQADHRLLPDMMAEISRHGPALQVGREQVARFVETDRVVLTSSDTFQNSRLDEFLQEADAAHRWVVVETGPELTEWSKRALRSADRVLFITSPFASDEELRRLRAFVDIVAALDDREMWMVQSNAAAVRRPRVNSAAREIIDPDRIVQIRRNDPLTSGRLARLATGTATGVACSGGGGRGLAHIGALQALADCGIEVDVVAGTSMGSIVAASLAYNELADDMFVHLRDAFEGAKIVDYTLPVSSLSSGRALTEAIDEMCGPLLIEELWLPFSCVSTNLTTAARVVHREGLLTESLRASVSLPGVFPPVALNGHLFVDGGVLENLPISPLVSDPAVSTVIAIDVAPPGGPAAGVDYGSILTGSTALRDQLTRQGGNYPQLAATVMSSMLLASTQARRNALDAEQVDLYLSLSLSGIKLLDFDDLTLIAQKGYDAAMDDVQAWTHR